MSVTKVNADVFDLTDAYALSGTVAFSGTVTGTPLSGWTFVSTVTASTSSTIDFTNMTTGYDWQYVYEQLALSDDGAHMRAYFGVSGPTYRTSAYISRVGGIINAAEGTAVVTAYASVGGYSTQGNADTEQQTGELILIDPVAARHTNFYHSNHYENGDGEAVFSGGGGFYNGDEAHPAIRFYVSAGTILSGSIHQYKRANA
jgi:hypothetical protein